jgi:hypothetical protein
MTAPTAQVRPARLAVDLAKSLPLSDASRALLAPTHTVSQFFTVLAGQLALAEDAIRFLATSLPKREAVLWAVACVKLALPKPSPEAAKAIACAEAWVKDSSEANRRACEPAASAAGQNTAPGCLACAAFWSGSLSAPHLPPTPPRDDLTGIGVTAALLLAAVIDPARAAEMRTRFVALGADVVNGKLKV